ncbi:MAG: hypothetical protein GX992_09805 [Clostridium sp.]|nr:hypothetical protein [Clostridium sp.]
MIIEVNHKTLRTVATAIKNYCSFQESEMNLADAEIKSMLLSGWLGPDAQQFGREWECINEKGSTSAELRESLENLAENLIACANEYQTAQEDSVNEASLLPKYFYW